MIAERAPAKVNLVLHVGPRREDGLHELASLFAAIDLADEVAVERATGGDDRVTCSGVPGENICDRALRSFRARTELGPLDVRIEKRIPVAAGLGGGSADAAAVLRAANRLSGDPLDEQALMDVAAEVGADVPSQIEPRHALVSGAGERVEPVELPGMALVLLPQDEGLSTADVYAEADRMGAIRPNVDPERLRAVTRGSLSVLAAAIENDLEPAALALRPELRERLASLRETGALAAAVTGSGPTVFGVFDAREHAREAARDLPGAIVAGLLPGEAAGATREARRADAPQSGRVWS